MRSFFFKSAQAQDLVSYLWAVITTRSLISTCMIRFEEKSDTESGQPFTPVNEGGTHTFVDDRSSWEALDELQLPSGTQIRQV